MADVRGAVAQLEACARGGSAHLRSAVVDALSGVGLGDAAGVYGLCAGSAPQVAWFRSVGLRDAGRTASGLEDVAGELAGDAAAGTRDEARRFLVGRQVRSRVQRRHWDLVSEELWRPEGLVDEVRLRVYDGDRYVGLAYLVSRGRSFGSRDALRLRPLVPQLRRLLVLADREERGAYPDLPGDVLVVDGAIRYASEAGRRWLEVDGVEDRVAAAVRGAARGAGRACPPVFAVRRMEGAAGEAWLLTLQAPSPVRRSPLASLTPTQARVAELVAVGATRAEVASNLGVSPETVKTHTRDIYRKLDVADRLELAARLGEP